ncbi:hypothetical protein BV898_19732 [Hypsibius exemplaris]|uniref:Uncharacterized protein n=1 Tax=Hypsibius exemplaris TaxID=2072580 RepID=A0A9X6NLZ7_HYPEX|nr:hypothetical protein BV898_19732 [Hypsibius exemplaris]
MTGFWDNEQNFFMSRPGIDNVNPIKCCKPPPGYYIDYTSCYYQPTHDQYWEFYDSLTHNLVVCASGFVVTGLAKKFGPIVRVNNNPTEWHIDWLQCCRVGYSGQRTIDPARRLPSNTTLPPKPFSFG